MIYTRKREKVLFSTPTICERVKEETNTICFQCSVAFNLGIVCFYCKKIQEQPWWIRYEKIIEACNAMRKASQTYRVKTRAQNLVNMEEAEKKFDQQIFNLTLFIPSNKLVGWIV